MTITLNYKFLLAPFLIGLISSQKLYLIGELYIGEVMAIAYLIYNFKLLRLSGAERTIFLFAVLWSCAQLISDLINNSAWIDAIKGIFAPLVFLSTLIFLVNYLNEKFDRLPSLLLGITIGELIQLLIFPTVYFIDNSWKWGFGGAVLGIFIIYFSFFKENSNKTLLFMVLILFLIISLYFDGRSLAIFPILSALIYSAYYGHKKSTFIKRFSGKFVGIKLVIIVLPLLYVMNLAASSLFSSEVVLSHFSTQSAHKYRIQASGAYGMLLGGRTEILASGQAFFDKPLFGHGSWPKDKNGYRDKYSILRQKLGYSLREDGGYEESAYRALIPSHSYLMGAFVWAGVFGGLFWLVLLNSTLRLFLININLLPLYFHIGMIGFLWNVFFSPFGASGRWGASIFLASLFSYVNFLKTNSIDVK